MKDVKCPVCDSSVSYIGKRKMKFNCSNCESKLYMNETALIPFYLLFFLVTAAGAFLIRPLGDFAIVLLVILYIGLFTQLSKFIKIDIIERNSEYQKQEAQ